MGLDAQGSEMGEAQRRAAPDVVQGSYGQAPPATSAAAVAAPAFALWLYNAWAIKP